MKPFKLLLTLLLATSCLADNQPIRNDTPTTLRDLAANLNVGSNYAVNKYGQLQCLAVVGDGGATSAYKLEDVASASGDAGVFVLGVRNDSITSLTNANGDYSAIATLSSGAVIGSIQSIWTGSSFQLAAIPEDAAASSGDVVYPMGAITQEPLTVDQNTNGDYANLKTDRAGRLITAPAGASETWQSCGTATASTADVAIKAAVASHRIYVTSITCSNSSATTASNINFKDATTVIAVGGVSSMAATASGAFFANFPVPLRGSVNTAFNFNTAVAVTSTICCATGYISTN